ncbi:MAG: hypothetical protein U0M12_09450 [Acutalibacteraceae bacterium]|nr:hypothetical protein [Acutalibacteraceae bacterium]
MKKSGKALVIIIVVLLILFVALGAVIYWLYTSVTDVSEADKLNTTASTTIYKPLVKSIVLGEEQQITDDDINGIIATIMNEYTAKQEVADENAITVQGASVYLQGENSAKLYVDLNWRDTRIIFSADATVQLNAEDKTITMTLSNTKLGTLSIPTDWIMKTIEPSLTIISSKVSVNGNSVIVPSEYTFEFMEKKLTLYITRLEISQGSASVQTNSAMNVIEQFIDEFIKGMF